MYLQEAHRLDAFQRIFLIGLHGYGPANMQRENE